MSFFYDFTTATSSRVRWTSSVLSFFASMKILTWLNGLWNESSGAGRVVSREKKVCGSIIYGVYLADEIFLRQEEILQLNSLFSWKLCTGNWIHEAEEIKNSGKRRMIKKPSDAHDLQLLLLYPADHRSAQFETSFIAKFQPAVSLGRARRAGGTLVPECQLKQRAAEDTSERAPLPLFTCTQPACGGLCHRTSYVQ